MTTVQDLYDQGYHVWHADLSEPFENNNGPMLMKKQADGTWRSALVVEEKHLNALGTIHGGALMSFADFSLFVFARSLFDGDFRAVTVSMNSDFLDGAVPGELIEGIGEVTRETGSMIFSRGGLYAGDRCLLTFSGVIKKLRDQ